MITLGGDAELELVDSLDPFSEGIVFSVRPPKKSWKNIANLSGGEKTLSSLALVFALHHFKVRRLLAGWRACFSLLFSLCFFFAVVLFLGCCAFLVPPPRRENSLDPRHLLVVCSKNTFTFLACVFCRTAHFRLFLL